MNSRSLGIRPHAVALLRVIPVAKSEKDLTYLFCKSQYYSPEVERAMADKDYKRDGDSEDEEEEEIDETVRTLLVIE